MPNDFDPNSYVMKFGKYKGVPLKRVPTEYLVWYVSLKEKEMDMFANELEDRGVT